MADPENLFEQARESVDVAPDRLVESSSSSVPPIAINESALRPVSVLAWIALGLWLVSLALPAFEPRLGDDIYYGWAVLLLAWLPPGTLAWSANVFFLVAVAKLVRGRPATRSALLAALLSLTTFVVDAFPAGSSGGTVRIYGYSWGALLWFLAIFVLLAAAFTLPSRFSLWPPRRQRLVYTNDPYVRRLRLSVVPLLVLLATFAVLGMADRAAANEEERQRLRAVMFKQGAVCTTAQATVGAPLTDIAVAPLLMDLKDGGSPYALRSYKRIRDWLALGLSSVRYNGYDYAAVATEPEGVLVVATQAQGPIAGTLNVDIVLGESARGGVRVALTDQEGRLVFDQTWRQEKSGALCPDYTFETFDADAEPLRTIRAGLGLRGIAPAHRPPATEPTLIGSIIGPGTAVEPRFDRLAHWRSENPQARGAIPMVPRAISHAEGCPSDHGWTHDSDPYHRGVESWLGSGFKTPTGVFYSGTRDDYALCEGEWVYVYTPAHYRGTHPGAVSVVLEKRRLPSFALAWKRQVEIPGIPGGNYELTSVEETGGAMIIELAHERQRETFRVEVPLR